MHPFVILIIHMTFITSKTKQVDTQANWIVNPSLLKASVPYTEYMKKYRGGIAMIRTMKKTTVMRIPLMTLALENLGYFRVSKNHLIKKMRETLHFHYSLGIYHLILKF